MKAGFLQFSPVFGNVEATIARIDSFSEQMKGADLIVLPELANSGYNFESAQQAFFLAEEVNDSVFLQYLQRLCQKHSFYLVTGFNEKEGEKLYNTSLLTGPDGIVGKYRKLHLFNNEKKIFTPGNIPLQVFDIGLAKIGMLVCFDWSFPEVWRCLALMGAQIICHPSNLVLPGFAQRVIPVYSLLNNVFIITSNRVGTEGDLTFTGMSTFSAPKGRMVTQAPPTGDCLFLQDIEIEETQNKMLTPLNHIFNDRRPEFYKQLIMKG